MLSPFYRISLIRQHRYAGARYVTLGHKDDYRLERH